MNNCYDSCNSFFKNKSDQTLGNIKKSGDCANCLYWTYGPGRPIYDQNNCECNQTFQKVSNFGTNFDMKGYNEVNNCLKNSKKCGYLPDTFTNTSPTCQITEYTQMKPCNKKRKWNPTLKYDGVF